MRPVLGLSAILAMIASSAIAAEDEVVVAFEPGYALLTRPADLHGAGAHLTVSYGLTDELWLTGSFGGGRQLSRGEAPGLWLFEGFGGLTVAIDVLRTIPFVEVLIGAVGADLTDRTKVEPTVRLGAGFDFLVTPSFSLGPVFRYRPVSDDLGESLFTIDLRLAFRLEL